jgi:ATP-dependent DNA helicase Rep
MDQLCTLLQGKTLEEAMFDLTGGDPTGNGDNNSRVHLMTLHSSKGTEYHKVVMMGCEEGITPHINSENLEEERRLFYVGMTRAEQELIFTYTRKRLMFGNYNPMSPTRFLKEIGLAY